MGTNLACSNAVTIIESWPVMPGGLGHPPAPAQLLLKRWTFSAPDDVRLPPARNSLIGWPPPSHRDSIERQINGCERSQQVWPTFCGKDRRDRVESLECWPHIHL